MYAKEEKTQKQLITLKHHIKTKIPTTNKYGHHYKPTCILECSGFVLFFPNADHHSPPNFT
jgi:hypothetical protein